jgi:hypothetical protein
MDQITNITLFTGPINIDTSRPAIEVELNAYCVAIEAKQLKKLLGKSLYAEYVGNEGADQKWLDLINGIIGTFTYNGQTCIYTGLKDKFCYLIYEKYTNEQFTSNTPIGGTQAKPANGELNYDIPRAVSAHNEWVDAFNDAVDFIRYKNSTSPETYPNFNTSKEEHSNVWGI